MPKTLTRHMTRRIALRMPEEEYERLKRFGEAVNASSVSEMVRTSVTQWIEHRSIGSGGGIQSTIQDLERRVSALKAQVEKLNTSAPEA